ncbi:hypothetical protein STRTUCAR8_09850 [Streptomyces turgidiscabies Car8]|uniref:Uncharacterized protein n=1 Tax=Streptomyces turgidiscabies (strain Car8) TaxID=698760 RepID=L7FIR0_STRT8|nr:hypothetical protein STRTUCAR8_09850 [Streptomyces turgidiscabies Car8]
MRRLAVRAVAIKGREGISSPSAVPGLLFGQGPERLVRGGGKRSP